MIRANFVVGAMLVIAVAGCQQDLGIVEPDLGETGNELADAVEHDAADDGSDAQIAELANAAVIAAVSENDIQPFEKEGESNLGTVTDVPMPNPISETDERDVSEPLVAGIEDGAPTSEADEASLISDEQDFAVVSSRETIESDAERQQTYRNSRLVFEPVELQSAAASPNLARYAIQSTHEIGTKVYRRFIFAKIGFEDRCAEFVDDDAAQREFLRAGGPKQDRLRIDPDGDGFACGWTPDIYRRLIK